MLYLLSTSCVLTLASSRRIMLSREEARVSTQFVLNKYNTNYEALRLADSTALAFKSWKIFIKANYYKLMNYHKPSYIVINQN